jgi:lipoprotein NlpI
VHVPACKCDITAAHVSEKTGFFLARPCQRRPEQRGVLRVRRLFRLRPARRFHLACAGIALLALVATRCLGEEVPVPAATRATVTAEFTQQLRNLDQAINASSENVDLYSRRGDAHLFLGHFAQAVADFEKMIALDPSQDAPHWRLGIAYYFNGDFAKAMKQFEKYHAHDGRDRENGIWKFMAQAKSEGIEKARAGMLPYSKFDREPFPILYEMFAGRKTDDDLASAMTRNEVRDDRTAQFFANYYLGVYEHLLGEDVRAREHIGKALALFSDANKKSGPGYMWQIARLEYDRLLNAELGTRNGEAGK